MKKLFVMYLVLLIVGCRSAAAAELSVPITVEEPAGVGRSAEPVSGGVPLPAKTVKKGQAFALFDGEKELPVQVSPLVIDEQGYLRWILLDFQADLKRNETKTLTLKAVKPAAEPNQALKTTVAAEAVQIETGKVTIRIAKDRPFGLLTSETIAGDESATVSYVDGFTGKRYAADKPASVEIEYNGPMRTTVCVKGRFVGDDPNQFQYIARITAWAGKSAVHVKYALANSNPDHYCYRLVKESSIELELAQGPRKVVLGASEPIEAEAPAALEQHLWPDAAGAGKALSGGEVAWTSKGEGDHAEGWILVKSKAGNVQCCDLYFPEDPARRLAVNKRRIVLGGVIEREKGKIKKWKDRRGRDRTTEVGAPYRETRRMIYDCSHLTSQYLIDLDAPDDPAELSHTCKAARERVWVRVPPDYALHNGHFPFGKFATQADEIACYKVWGWEHDPKNAPNRPRRGRGYPRYYNGTNNHYTPEEDVLDQLVIMYLRTGGRAYFNSARSWANYFMDRTAWRTDGWRWKDGGVWWYSGPKGNRPQRTKDPVTGFRNYHHAPWVKPEKVKDPVTYPMAKDLAYLGDCKTCYCHNWAAGIFEWYLLTGDRDALEAGVDRVEQDYDTQRRAKKKIPGKANSFSRGFNRSVYNAQAAGMVLPNDKWIVDVSDYFWQAYFQRPRKEPRGFVNAPGRPKALRPPRRRGKSKEEWDRAAAEKKKLENFVKKYAGEPGLEAMKKAGVTFDFETGLWKDPEGHTWQVLVSPHTWMFPPLSRGVEAYYRRTGDEDAMDWVIAYGQAAARLLYQPHGTLHYGKMLVDFPQRGVAKDWLNWVTDNKLGTGVSSSGFLARFHPDVCARAYSLCGEPLLKQRALDFWRGGSHRRYNSTKPLPFDKVAQWVNFVSDHDGQVDFVLRTFYIWSHPRKDQKPPEPIRDLKVSLEGDVATVTFTAPADQGGGGAARYQVKCSDKPIVDYATFLDKFNHFQDEAVTNWWMATNLDGEPAPKKAGATESFVVTGVPKDATYFAVRTFDDSSNRAAVSNVAKPE
ncbi:MAG: hypothetical protein ACOC8E_00035 [Planctomycetota bacterium]